MISTKAGLTDIDLTVIPISTTLKCKGTLMTSTPARAICSRDAFSAVSKHYSKMEFSTHPKFQKPALGSIQLFLVLLFGLLAPVFAQDKVLPETPKLRIAYTSLSGNMAP
jgi:hypothetical protein